MVFLNFFFAIKFVLSLRKLFVNANVFILKSLIVIIHVKETEKYFPVVLFIVYRLSFIVLGLCQVALMF